MTQKCTISIAKMNLCIGSEGERIKNTCVCSTGTPALIMLMHIDDDAGIAFLECDRWTLADHVKHRVSDRTLQRVATPGLLDQYTWVYLLRSCTNCRANQNSNRERCILSMAEGISLQKDARQWPQRMRMTWGSSKSKQETHTT